MCTYGARCVVKYTATDAQSVLNIIEPDLWGLKRNTFQKSEIQGYPFTKQASKNLVVAVPQILLLLSFSTTVVKVNSLKLENFRYLTQ